MVNFNACPESRQQSNLSNYSLATVLLYCDIQDLDGIYELPDFATFVRGVDPTGIANVTLTGINIPIRIAEATVLPGDIVLGRRGGVIFIPPHFAQQVVEQGEEVALRDRFGHQRLREGSTRRVK